MKNYVWCPQYCYCTYEGGMTDLAICSTRAKARFILAEHKRENRGRWWERHDWEVWRIEKRNIDEYLSYKTGWHKI